MKRIISIMLAVLMLLSCFTGCGDSAGQESSVISAQTGKNGELDLTAPKPGTSTGESVTVTILTEKMLEAYAGSNLRKAIKYLYPDINIEYIVLPDGEADMTERETMVANIRAEVMAGKGPDLFLLSTWIPELYVTTEPFFKDVEKTMNNGIFLPLDDYISSSRFLDMSEHPNYIMNAGKNRFGQLVMPLTYSLPTFFLDKEYIPDPNTEYGTWDEILRDGEEDVRNSIKSLVTIKSSYLFGDIIDYDKGDLLITEEHLLDTVMMTNSLYEVPEDAKDIYLWGGLNSDVLMDIHNEPEEIYTMLMPNVDGGSTAMIKSYAAINANAVHPNEAFKILDFLFSDYVQTGEGFYSEEHGKWYGNFAVDFCFNTIASITTSKHAYTNEHLYNREVVDYLIGKVSCVRFTAEVDMALHDMYRELTRERYGPNADSIDYEKYVSECYSKMKMIAAE